MVNSSKTQPALPPTVRAILSVGGAREVASRLGAPVTARMVEQWLQRSRTPVTYLRRLSAISGVTVDEFLEYEERQG